MSPRVLIEPPQLRDAARAMRDGRESLGELMMRVRGGLPDMPADVRARVEDTLLAFNLDLTEQRDYMAGEAEELERRAYLAARADGDAWSLLLSITDLFGFGGPPALGERWTPPPPPPPPPEPDDDGGGFMGFVHGVLDVGGFIPGAGAIPDLLNAGIYAIEGDGENAAWAAGAAVPLFGDAAKGRRMLREGAQATTRHGDEVAAAARQIDDVLDGARQVRGSFPRTAGPNEVLIRRHPDTGAPTHYQHYDADGLPVRRVDLTGRAHGGVPTPHVVEYTRHVNPETGEVFVRPDRHVRPANPDEIPS